MITLKQEARLYNRLDSNKVLCVACAHRCTISAGERSICHVRENRGGTLYTLAYNNIANFYFNQIEKAPFYHFWPGSRVAEVGTVGCNFRCEFCCSWSMSQIGPEEFQSHFKVPEEEFTPEMIVESAKRVGCSGIVHTNTEPMVSFEYLYDIAEQAHKKGLFNAMVTNGYHTPEALDELVPVIDAMNITLKSFSDKFYREVCGASLEPVLETITMAKEKDIHVEMAYLLIPGHTDGKEVEKMVRFVAEVDPEMPTFFLRFFPSYKIDGVPMTPEGALDRARRTGLDAGLKYVYIGNTYTSPGKHTYCPGCGEMVIERMGDRIFNYELTPENRCPDCGEDVLIVGRFACP